MNEDDEQQIAAALAKTMAMVCVRNSLLENLHAGRVPVTRTGNYSDVVVTDADGRQIPWSEVSRFDDDEMRALMRSIVDRLYTFHMRVDDPTFRGEIERWSRLAAKWDEPKLDANVARPEAVAGE